MPEWKTYNLDEVYDFASGLSKSRDEFGFGFPFLSFMEVFNNYFVPRNLNQLANTSDLERARCSVERGDVFLTRTSETQEDLGMSCVALKDYPETTFNGFTKRLRPKGTADIVPEYAGFYFRSPRFRAEVTSMSSVTTRASLNNDMLSALKVTVPPADEQRAIAGVLSGLDNKIDLLHRQNKTLETLAEILFRQWFVEDANDAWEEGTLGDVASNVRDSLSRKRIDAKSRYVGLEHIDRRCVALGQFGVGADVSSNKYAFQVSDVLFGKLRPYFHKVCLAPFAGVCSTDILVIRPRRKELLAYCLFAFFQDDVVEYANLGSGGTRMPRTDWGSLSKFEIKLPDEGTLSAFNKVVLPSLNKINFNLKSIETLEKLRDTLLPKLMSGEVRVRYE